MPEPDEAEPELPDPEEPPAWEEPEEVAPLCVEPGRISATAPAAARLAKPTAVVVVWILLRPRSRAATARATVSRFVSPMTRSLGPLILLHLSAASQPPMSRGSCPVAVPAEPAHHDAGACRLPHSFRVEQIFDNRLQLIL